MSRKLNRDSGIRSARAFSTFRNMSHLEAEAHSQIEGPGTVNDLTWATRIAAGGPKAWPG
jgi:hypothetical protein